MNNKNLFINMISNIISFGVAFGISFFLSPYLIGTVGADAYGFYPLANNFVTYAQLLVIALNSMAIRYITIKMVEGNKEEVNIYYSSIFYANIILSVILAIPLSGIVIFINNRLHLKNFMSNKFRLFKLGHFKIILIKK